MAPIYGSYDDYQNVKSTSPQPFIDAGKIVTHGQYVFVNEHFKGIHVIDNSDPKMPKDITFISITGNSNFTIKDNILYADNGRHLLVIDITDVKNAKFVTVIKDHYKAEDLRDEYPQGHSGWFECYDASKGLLLGWKLTTLNDPRCRTR
jgi:hypothetical protein